MRFAHRHWESSHHLSLSLSTPHRQARGFQARGVPGPDRSLPSSAVVVGIVACCMIAFAVCIANLRAPPPRLIDPSSSFLLRFLPFSFFVPRSSSLLLPFLPPSSYVFFGFLSFAFSPPPSPAPRPAVSSSSISKRSDQDDIRRIRRTRKIRRIRRIMGARKTRSS